MKRNKLLYLPSVLFWLLVWHFGAQYINQSLLIPVPLPAEVLSAAVRLWKRGTLVKAAGASLLRITAGFMAAFLFGTMMALISAKYEFFHILTAPLLGFIRAVPVASFTILIFLWVKRENIPSCISFLTVFPIVWTNIENGAHSADGSLAEMGQVFGMEKKQILKEITLPSLKPFISAAAAGGMGFAWKSGVAAEIICRTSGSLGNLLWVSKSSIDYDEVFAVTLVIVLLSALLQCFAEFLLKGGKIHDPN